MSRILKLYFDANIFIDIVKEKFEIDPSKATPVEIRSCKELFEQHKNSTIKIVTSFVSLAEVIKATPNTSAKEETKAIKDAIHGLMCSGEYCALESLTYRGSILARDIQWKHGLPKKPLDAVHLATAIENKCDEFVTMDTSDFNEALGAEVGIRVIVPSASSAIRKKAPSVAPVISEQLPLTGRSSNEPPKQ